MIKGIINWLRRNTFLFSDDKIVDVQAKPAVSSKNKTYLIDASVPSLIVDNPVPTTTFLPMTAQGDSGGGFPLGTKQQQASGLRQMVNEALVFMSGKSPKRISKWAATSNLTLSPRAGVDLNAYYDRKSLKFFYFTDNVRAKVVYASDSRTVVTHEFGHALLDIIRPDLWDLVSDEVWAFHEAFGDMVAILNNLQYDGLIDYALTANPDLTQSNAITRLAADMGIGLYDITNGQDGVLKNCLRDATIKYTYVSPSSLPSDGRDDQLLNEPHSFSRVFVSMFWSLVVQFTNSYMTVEKLAKKQALLRTRDTLASYIMQAATTAPANTKFFKSVCLEMLVADTKNKKRFQNILLSTFSEWKITDAPIKMMNNMTYDDIIKNVHSDFEYRDQGETKVLCVGKVKKIKLSDLPIVNILGDDPLANAEIEVAGNSTYYFDSDMNLQDSVETTEEDITQTVISCISLIKAKNWLGEHEKAQFNLVDGKLVRTRISACGCNKPNYCIPGSPEYQKPWKPKNNAGCVACKSKCEPRSCDCANPTPAPAPKTGCYTSVSSCKTTSVKVGSRISRKVC